MPFLVLLIAHVVADMIHFPGWVAPRDEAVVPDYLRRGAVYAAYIFGTSFLWRPSLAPFLIGGVMLALRVTALRFCARAGERGAELARTSAALAAHALMLFLLSKLLPDSSWLISALRGLTGAQIGAQALFILLSYLLISAPAAEFVSRMLGLLRGGEAPASNRAGRLIGILERAMVLTLAIVGQYAAIGFVLAAKSVARFKDFEKPDFTEQYIVGTLTSIGIAILLASVCHALPI